MPRSLHSGSVMPRGLIVDHVEAGPGLTIIARPVAASACCPDCDQPSFRVHSHYTRTLSDLPVAGGRVLIAVRVRRFRCDGTDCRTRIFAERLGPDLAAAYARRTARLDAEWTGGCRNGAELWRRLRASGFTGSLRVVGEWATRRRRSERAPEGSPGKVPSARILSRLMTTGRDSLTKAEAVLVATIEAEVPMLAAARALLSRFQAMIHERRRPDLDTWIEAAARSLLASFAGGLQKDKMAVAAALAEPQSNGRTEGQISRLKLVKRQMFGRAKLDLLEARMIGAP